MTPSFVEELFMRIEERLVNLEKEIGEIRGDLAIMSDEMLRCRECRVEIADMKQWFSVGRGAALVIWGLIVTVLNLLIGKWINGSNKI